MLLSTESLGVGFSRGKQTHYVTSDVDIEIDTGETVALVGESGSGKSVTAMEIAGLNPRDAVSNGKILLEGKDVLSASHKKRRELLRRDIGVIFQDPLSSLNPVYKVGISMAMSMRYRGEGKRSLRERAIELLDRVNIPDPDRVVDRYPHELSGGQRQRVMIAMAIDTEPKLIIADEPTTALDVTVQADILNLLDTLKSRLNMSMLLITHDMGVVANSADRMYVMRQGTVCEAGPVSEVFAAPQHEYTRKLFAAVPQLDAEALAAGVQSGTRMPDRVDQAVKENRRGSVLRFKQVDYYYSEALRRSAKKALDRVSFDVRPGETVGLVGESGSGKSTIGRIAVGLLKASDGTVDEGEGKRDIYVRSMVFQDPASSLDPRRTIGESIAAPLVWGKKATRSQALGKAQDLLERVHLPRQWSDRLPHQLSGGQRQRVGIARALIVDPDLLIADEPTSALDVSVQSAVLDLFSELQKEFGFSCIFISHDLAVVEKVSHRVLVLRNGQVQESGSTQEIIYSPRTEYTRRLIESVPVPNPELQRRRKVERLAPAKGQTP